MRGTVALVLVLAMTGCMAPTNGHSKVSIVNGTSLASMMPDPLPAGFQVGYETKDAMHLSRVYDYSRNNETIYHSLSVTVSKYDSYEEARDAFASMRDSPSIPQPNSSTVTPDFVSSEQILGDTRDPATTGYIERAYGFHGVFIVTVFEQTRGQVALTNVSAIARHALAIAPP